MLYIKQLAKDHLDGLITSEEFCVRLLEAIAAQGESMQADENMLEIAKQLVKE